MDHRARPAVAAAGALLGLVLLVGCGFSAQPTVTRLPPAASVSSTPTGTPSPATTNTRATPAVSEPPVTAPGDGSVVSCVETGTASVTGSERSVRVDGTCTGLTVSGSALTVDASGSSLGALTMSGDRLRVTAEAVDTATVQGNDTALSVTGGLASLDLSGDRATVSVGGALGSLVLRGQDSVVTAGGGIGDSTVEGRGNRVG